MKEEETSSAPVDEADVQVSLRGVGSGRQFVLENLGGETAREVRVAIDSAPGKISPLVQGELDRMLPVALLAPGEERSLSAIITTGTGIAFTATVSWQLPDGSRQETVTNISI